MGLSVSVYRNAQFGDCTMNGISSKHQNLTIVNINGPSEPNDDAPAVWLESHYKGCLRIARDIKRRLLPGYLAAFDAAVEKARQRNQADNDEWETTRELANIIGYKFLERELEDRKAQLRWDAEERRGYGDVRINSADSIDIKLSCDRAIARKVLELLSKVNANATK